MTRRGHTTLGVVAALVVAVSVILTAGFLWRRPFDVDPSPLPTAADPLLPDLAMGPIEDVGVGTTPAGGERLRFAAKVVNVGRGQFVVRAARSWPWSSDWNVRQLIDESGGGFTERATAASLVYGGDGHNHWHVQHVEAHELLAASGDVVGRLVKQGFCFFDTDAYRAELPGAPPAGHWGSKGCASTFDPRVRMGLSVGWGDKYPWYLIDERIDVSDVPDGRYVIRQIADPLNQFVESDETNNSTSLRIELLTRSDGLRDVRTLEAGPPP